MRILIQLQQIPASVAQNGMQFDNILFLNYFIFMAKSFTSLRTVSVLLTTWLDKVVKQHNGIRATFDKLRLYIEHFKPIAEVDEQMRKKLTTFLDHTYSCHLYAIRSNAPAVRPMAKT